MGASCNFFGEKKLGQNFDQKGLILGPGDGQMTALNVRPDTGDVLSSYFE